MSFWETESAGWTQDVDGIDVTYTPVGGTPRTVVGIVDYDGVEEMQRTPGQRAIKALLTVCNRGTSKADDGRGGIASSAYNSGGDTVAIPPRVGKAAESFRIVGEPFKQDAGRVTYTLA